MEIVRVVGEGRAEVPAYGIADAEHQVEKELGRLWPEARVRILEARRTDSAPRLVEEFAISYRLDAAVTVEVDAPDDAHRAAFRTARSRLEGSRYARTEWKSA